MNTNKTKEWVEQNGVITVKADLTRPSTPINDLLKELGNTGGGIPFYAIFPGDGRPPIVHDGILTQDKILEMLKEAGPSKGFGEETPATTAEDVPATAMN